jgi:hypothetical protein
MAIKEIVPAIIITCFDYNRSRILCGETYSLFIVEPYGYDLVKQVVVK